MQFDNPARIAALAKCLQSKNSVAKVKEEMIKIMKAKNKALLKSLFAGRITQEMSADVSEYTFPNGSVIVKSFLWDEGDFPGNFQEVAGNIIVANLINTKVCTGYVRMFDVFVQKDTLFMVFEKLEGDVETIEDLEDQSVMFDLLFQLTYALTKMQEAAGLVHFDLRSDNVLIEHLDEPTVLYPDVLEYESTFRVKIADFGQCELNVGKERPENDEIARGEEYVKQWGEFPKFMCPGYDMQYFVYTLPDILEGFAAQYYILTTVTDYINEGVDSAIPKTREQSRPVKTSYKSAADLLNFLKTDCFAML